jgi:hypothetical protein
MTAIPKVLINTVYPYPRTICVEVYRKISTGRRALRNPPLTSTRNIKGQIFGRTRMKILKGLTTK